MISNNYGNFAASELPPPMDPELPSAYMNGSYFAGYAPFQPNHNDLSTTRHQAQIANFYIIDLKYQVTV